MERDINYIREELDEVTLTHLRRWIVLLEEAQGKERPCEIQHNSLPGYLAYLNSARNALCRAEVLAGSTFEETASVRVEVDERVMDEELITEEGEIDVHEEIVEEFIEKERVYERSGRSRECGRARGERGRS
ncbi:MULTISPECIES: hypothetical protein [Pseudovibrio]|uniref:hypothetical protein n=1 Tax=Stappiaceae TaxID=2821832 RepID=UPI0023668EF8|nr:MULTISPECIES: hypothetical protein [Pseudovibrio]MDD7910375.1 hypothetical protein [Pseudovibrio exalbescens]MDX5594090.1 hypothetical protein [Pseudovibrio sp. SPO723]